MYRLDINNTAKRQIKQITKIDRDAVIAGLHDLQENPHIGKPLGKNLTGRYTYRVGVYRIIYTIDDKDKIIRVFKAGHRSTVYQ